MTNVTNTTTISIHTDGACRNNGSVFALGGWAAVLENEREQLRMSGHVRSTTSSRMELQAVIEGLKAISREHALVRVFTDSKYVQKGCSEWLAGWKRNGWRRSDGKPVLNLDLWQELDALLQKHDVEFCWVKGHNGHPMNELADRLAAAASYGQKLRYRTHAGDTGPNRRKATPTSVLQPSAAREDVADQKDKACA